jgi:hypothetical protein
VGEIEKQINKNTPLIFSCYFHCFYFVNKVYMETLTNPHQANAHFVLPENDKPIKEPTIKLTPEQIEFFQTNGFLSIDRLIDDEEVDSIRNQYDQVDG